jgi:hypothetical protein
MNETQTFNNVWDALEDDTAERGKLEDQKPDDDGD